MICRRISVSGKTITAQSTKALPANSGATLNVRLPEGYFVGARTNRPILIAFFLISAALIAAAFWFYLRADHISDVITEVLTAKYIAVGSPTILNGILASVQGFLYYLKSLRYKGKKAAVFGCFGWSGEGNKILRQLLGDAGFEVVEPEVKSSWNPEEGDFARVPALVEALLK